MTSVKPPSKQDVLLSAETASKETPKYYMRDYGLRVHQNGYSITPIRLGHKAPALEGWQKIKSTTAIVQQWSTGAFGPNNIKYARNGIGVLCENAPLVDLDIRDVIFIKSFVEWIEVNFGFAPARIGEPPKVGLAFHSTVPFRKITSREFADSKDRKAQVEILGQGQQYVAFAIYPDTKRPYKWPPSDSPLQVKRTDLPELTPEQGRKIVEEFERRAAAAGWTVVESKSKRPAVNGHAVDPDDIFGSQATDLSDDQLRMMVEAIPNEDTSYDNWADMMMAIHHQTGGSEIGRQIALDWSEKSGKHNADPKDPDKFAKTWNSLHAGPLEGRNSITARHIIKIYNDLKDEERALQLEDIKDRLSKAQDIAGLRAIAKDVGKQSFDVLDQVTIVEVLRASYKRITGNTLPIKEARKMVRADVRDAPPPWLSGWNFITHAERFFNEKTKQAMTARAFDAAFGRYVGDDQTASNFALHRVQIPTCHMYVYLPTEDRKFVYRGLECLNLYDDRDVPAVPDTLSMKDQRNLEIVKQHFRNLFKSERDIGILISWLSHIVKTRGRSNFCVVVQGAEGDGKTSLGELMAAALGKTNVRQLSLGTMKDSIYTDWAQGQQLTIIDEIKGNTAVLDKMKPFITNSQIEIHPKNINPYVVPNTVSYLALTNHVDALKLTNSDSRYFIMMTQHQTAEQLAKFLADKPNYFRNLYRAIEESPGAIRGWLLDYEGHAEFDPKGRAPQSTGRKMMIEQGRSEESRILSDAIKEGKNPRISSDMLVMNWFTELLGKETGSVPGGQVLKQTLRDEGFQHVGRVRLGEDKQSIWSKNPAKWMTDGECNHAAVRKYYDDLL